MPALAKALVVAVVLLAACGDAAARPPATTPAAPATTTTTSTLPDDVTCTEAPLPPAGVEVLGHQDLDRDGRPEVLGLHGDGTVGIWVPVGDCDLAEVTLDGVPARFPIGLDDTTAAGLSCAPQYVDDLYVVSLTSQDGVWYGGRIDAYDLVGGALVAAGGEGSEVGREQAEPMARVDCGDVQHP